ncbi:glycosyltransferase [Lolliginicoccus levis]|uniref:glycosyltransferase n=1 Tax=Lolliginicoccus levis TaxID=2919542 RepID=UPI00241BF4C4|nr:glycosyltransferase [Lolliginicoccus levis]
MTLPPSSPAASLAMVICCYTEKRWDLLALAIDAASAQAIPAHDEVIVVVDHNQALFDRVARAFPLARVVANSEQPGLSGARNTGARAATKDVLVYLDDDAILRDEALDALRAILIERAAIVVGGAVHPRWEGGRAPAWFPEEFGWVVGCDYTGIAPDGATIRNPIGACMAVDRESLLRIGGFSNELGRVGTLPVGCEETLMGIRIAADDPAAELVRGIGFAVDHAVPQDRQQFRYFLSRCYHEGRSKAILTAAVGSESGLSSERAYATRTLPAGVIRSLGEALRGDPAGARRAATIIVGLLVTAWGMLRGRLASLMARRPARQRDSDQLAPLHGDPINEATLITVVIPTVGRASLRRAVTAALAQENTALEVIVVDNAPSTGRARKALDGITDPRLSLIPEPRRGASAARNTGIARATGGIIAFTDDDAMPAPGWLATLRDAFALHPGIGCVTGRVTGIEISTGAQQWFEDAQVFDKGEQPRAWSIDPPEPPIAGAEWNGDLFRISTAGQLGSGNNMAFRSGVVRAIGGFDHALGPGTPTRGGEDLDLLRRYVLRGGTLYYEPAAVVGHEHRATASDLRGQTYGYGTGQGAILAKLVLAGGKPARAIGAGAGRGLAMALRPGAGESAKSVAPPLPLTLIELAGLLAGPALYLRSALAVPRGQRCLAARDPGGASTATPSAARQEGIT